MLLAALILVPALGAAGAYGGGRATRHGVWLVSVAVIHLSLVAIAWVAEPAPMLDGWLALDALGLAVLSVVSALFLVVATYAVGYLRRERARRAFATWLLAFLSAASLVAVSHHLALLWVGMEGTTLALAPLIFERRDRRSLEATWKYLVISSVGIALALLGTFFLATAQGDLGSGGPRPLVLEDLLTGAAQLHPAWLKAAFIFLLVGYGTKLGLAPMHTWKPDTYGEAPALVAALMAGGLTSCAFLGIARATQVTMAAGLASFARPPLFIFGLLSLAVAAAFVIGQSDVKRLLAYSSVEHVGLLVLGLGLGGVGPATIRSLSLLAEIIFQAPPSHRDVTKLHPLVAPWTQHIPVEQLQLQPGDILLLYTDGITEATDRAGTFFGENRLCASLSEYHTLSAQQIIDRLFDEVRTFTGLQSFVDDLTIVILKVE